MNTTQIKHLSAIILPPTTAMATTTIKCQLRHPKTAIHSVLIVERTNKPVPLVFFLNAMMPTFS